MDDKTKNSLLLYLLTITKGLNETLINRLKLYNRINKNKYSKKSIKRDKMCTIEIKIRDMCLHLMNYRTDNNIVWGLYTAASKGIYSTAMEVNNKQKKSLKN